MAATGGGSAPEMRDSTTPPPAIGKCDSKHKPRKGLWTSKCQLCFRRASMLLGSKQSRDLADATRIVVRRETWADSICTDGLVQCEKMGSWFYQWAVQLKGNRYKVAHHTKRHACEQGAEAKDSQSDTVALTGGSEPYVSILASLPSFRCRNSSCSSCRKVRSRESKRLRCSSPSPHPSFPPLHPLGGT